jgi:integrase
VALTQYLEVDIPAWPLNREQREFCLFDDHASSFATKKGVIVVSQQGQVFELKETDAGGKRLWAYRYRNGGRGSRRVQRGGFASEKAASEALTRTLERLRREQGLIEAPTLSDLVDLYLAQHCGEPETVAKLRWLLTKAVRAFGQRRINQLRPAEIATWRMNIAGGHRFEATQALRQVLGRAVSWGLIDVNPAKQGIDNPQRRYTEKRPFETWAELEVLAAELGPRYGPLVLFAAATGLRPGEWIALEQRDIDRDARVAYVRRAYRNGRVKCPKTEASVRAVPLQAIALDALERLPTNGGSPLVFPSPKGGYFDLHNFRNRHWKPAQLAAAITPARRVYDLRHTFATFALRAGISTFDLSRYMGASLTMIDRHYGHLARDGREHAINLLDTFTGSEAVNVHAVDAAWTSEASTVVHSDNGKTS